MSEKYMEVLEKIGWLELGEYEFKKAAAWARHKEAYLEYEMAVYRGRPTAFPYATRAAWDAAEAEFEAECIKRPLAAAYYRALCNSFLANDCIGPAGWKASREIEEGANPLEAVARMNAEIAAGMMALGYMKKDA